MSNATLAMCEETDEDGVDIESLERDLEDAIKAGEKASNALAALRYEDTDGRAGGGAGGGAGGDSDDCDKIIDLRPLYRM